MPLTVHYFGIRAHSPGPSPTKSALFPAWVPETIVGLTAVLDWLKASSEGVTPSPKRVLGAECPQLGLQRDGRPEVRTTNLAPALRTGGKEQAANTWDSLDKPSENSAEGKSQSQKDIYYTIPFM